MVEGLALMGIAIIVELGRLAQAPIKKGRK